MDFLVALILILNVWGLFVYLFLPGLKLLFGGDFYEDGNFFRLSFLQGEPELNKRHGFVFMVAFMMSLMFVMWMGVQHAYGGIDGFCKKIVDQSCTSENVCATTKE